MSTPKKPSEPLLVRVFIPEINAQKCVVVDPNDTVKAAEITTLEKIAKTENEPENYGLYLPSTHGRSGKFLDEERLLTDYALQGHVPQLELRYKSRDFMNVPGMTEKQILKANTKANQKKFIELVTTNALRKVEKALATGIDANFLTDDGNTPLGIACGRFGNPSMILTLVSGGTHIDFRGKDGLLPIHRAAIGGNSKAIKTLLSLGASPNSKDSKGLTPLYHAVIMGDHPEVCLTLLRDYAMVNLKDQHQWTELHHACKYGYTKHVDLLLKFKGDISAKNNVGNTPLHVSASHGQVDCAMLLLKRGADKQLLNNAGQPANQVAILCGHHQLSSTILRFSDSEIERITEPPNYNPHAKRPFIARSCHENSTTPNTPTASSLAEALLNSAKEDEQRKTDSGNGGGIPRQIYSTSNVQGSRQAPVPPLQKSSSMSCATRPTPKVNAAGVGIPRDIYITKGPQGYGFAMRGIKVPTSTFKPTPEVPAFQFVGSIDRNGSAEKASLKEGDYLIEANGHNIITSTHDEVVSIIVSSGKKLHLKVVTPAVKPSGLSTIHESPKAIKKQKSTATPSRHSSLHVSHGIPNKPNPPPQSSSRSNSPQDSVFKFPDVQKTEPPTEQQSKSNRRPPLTKSSTISDVVQSKPQTTGSMQASTVSDVVQSKPQTSMLNKQFSEDSIRPPSQFDSPARISTNSPDDENLSPFAEALRKASKAREERILTNQPRMLTTSNKQEHNPAEEEESAGITPQVQAGRNPITSSTTKQECKTEAESISIADSTDSQEVQQSKDSPQNDASKFPIFSLIKRFSGEYSDTESSESTHTDVGKTSKNFDKQHPNHTTNAEKSKSVTMIAKAFEGGKADDGMYNWRGVLKSVSKAPVVKSSAPNVEDSESTNVCERTTNRQMQSTPFTKKTSKTSLLAKKFEQNAMVKSETVVTKKAEKTLQQNLPEASIERVKQVSPSIADQKSVPLVENSLEVISSNENASSPVEKESNNENGILPVEKDSNASPVGQAAVSSTNEPLRRESAVVMYEEGKECDISLTVKYERSSVLVDTDYWKSPEHSMNIPGISEVSTSDIRVPDKTTVTEILPNPEFDILPPPIMSVDEELALSIEDLPLPEFLPPPEIDDFTDSEFQDLPPPPVDFPDSNFCQDTPSLNFDVSSTHDTDTFELPPPSQLPPHDDTHDFELPSPSQLPPHEDREFPSPSQLPPHDDTHDFELPSPSQLPPHDDTHDFELPSPSQLPPHDDTHDFELPSPSQLPPHDGTHDFELPSPSRLPPHEDREFPSPSQLPPHDDMHDFELPSPSQLPPHDDTHDFELPSPSQLPPHDDTEFPTPPQLPRPQEGSSDRDNSSSIPDRELSLENNKDENTEVLNGENLQYSPPSSITGLPSVKKTDSNSMSSQTFENNDISLQAPSSPSDLSDIPVSQDEEKVPSVNPDQHLADENHKSLEDNLSQGESYKAKPVMEWTVDDVCSWLDEIGLEEHIEMFWDNEIQGSHLVDMTKDDLKELGITRLGHRMTITNGISALLK